MSIFVFVESVKNGKIKILSIPIATSIFIRAGQDFDIFCIYFNIRRGGQGERAESFNATNFENSRSPPHQSRTY